MFNTFTFITFVLVHTALILTSNISSASKESEDKIYKTITNTTIERSNTTFGANEFHNLTHLNNDLQQSKNNQHMPISSQPIITEGGSIKPLSNTVSKLVENGSKKQFSKIVPRKGANSPEIITNTSTELSNLSTVKVSATNSVVLNETQSNNYLLINITTTEGSTKLAENVEDELVNNVTIKNTSTTVALKKHKPKPTHTVGELEDDKPIRSSSSTPTGNQNKIDYIVPVIIGIVTFPLLSAFIYMIYQRGRDCWDKRHYRRMDFLIDGMYNE